MAVELCGAAHAADTRCGHLLQSMDGKTTEDRHAVESRIISTEDRISRENAASELRLRAQMLEVLGALKDVQITIATTSSDR